MRLPSYLTVPISPNRRRLEFESALIERARRPLARCLKWLAKKQAQNRKRAGARK